GAGAGTMEQALIQAYQNNPQLKAQRAATRATDENVPTALAGYRPKVSGTSNLSEQYLDTLTRAGSTPPTGALYTQTKGAAAVTRTDVAQAESRLAAGRSKLSLAESNYVTAQAQYQQVIGVPSPPRLAPAQPVDRLSPRTLDGAIARGRSEHPLITTAMYNVD